MRTAGAIAISVVGFALVILIVCFVALKTGALSARKKPGNFEYAVANYALKLSIPKAVKNAKNPERPTPAALIDANKYFSENCAVCHGNDGSGKTDTARGLSPEVPDLKAAHVQNLSDGEMFYIIKNGVRFTGMPAWNLRDEQIWKMVLLTRQLSRPGTSPESRQNTSKQDSTQ